MAAVGRAAGASMRPLRWPLQALVVWAVAWGVQVACRSAGLSVAAAFVAATMAGLVCSRLGQTRSRRALIASGFPLSFVATGAAFSLPAWLWLALTGLLAAVYPVRRWGDAPLFPTPTAALRGLSRIVPLATDSRILDAGSGLGAAMVALHAEYPEARVEGIEWSWPLCVLSAWRCRWARVRRGDIWTADWSHYDMVYLFQRPETMAQGARKAAAELRSGAWLASLEFPVEGRVPTARHQCADGRSVWLYRVA